MTGIWAAVPVKGFEGAKQRLSPMLTPAQRHALAAAMLQDTLAALAQAPLDGIMVNTGDPEATRIVARFGAQVVTQDAASGHTAAVAAMARTLGLSGRAMLTVPGDIPGATADEFAAICQAARPPHSFTIVPAHDRRGSNAILLRPPDAVPLRFGDDSFEPHLQAARDTGIEPTILTLPGIALDLDQPQDVRAFLATPAARHTAAGALLAEWLSSAAAGGRNPPSSPA